MNAAPEKHSGKIGQVLARARRPDKTHMEALRQRMPFWFACLVLFGFAAVQIVLNPFGFSDLTQRYTQDISDLLITGPILYPPAGRDEVSVALIDDTALSDLQMPWPWTYGAQARALDSLLAYKPRAVIVDLLFVDPRNDNSLPELIGEIGRYKAAGVPLYFEGATSAPPGEPGLRRELADTGIPILDPTILVNQGVVRQYPVTGRCFRKRDAGQSCSSLALTVYKDLYHVQPTVTRDGLLELVWGTRSHPLNAKWMRITDADNVSHSCGEYGQMGWGRRIYLAFFDATAVRSSCPYTGVIPVEALLQGREDPDIDTLARNRIIFYGASLEGAQDKSFTPVNGLIANVFVHAMALDNLITFRGRPEQNVVVLGNLTLDSNTVQMAAIVPVILILCWMHFRRRRARHMKPRVARGATLDYILGKVVESIWHWLAFGLALAVGLFLTRAAGLSVANWVDVVFVSVALAAMLLVGLPDAMWGYLHHVAIGVPRQGDTSEETAG
jgi:hypothetical protein